MAKGSFILWFDEFGLDKTAIVGGKSASLGEMTRHTEVPIPYGFVTTAEAYRYFIEANDLRERIKGFLSELVDPNDTCTLKKVGQSIRDSIHSAPIPKSLAKAVDDAYLKLIKKVGKPDPCVAVRSSATAEDLPDASFAGQQETFLNVKGREAVIEKVKECYASLFTDRAICYRIQKGFNHMDVDLSAVVQVMIQSKASGVMFTLDCSNGDRSIVEIEAGFGLGEMIVQGKITPDQYMVRKEDLSIICRNIPKKTVQMVMRPEGGTEAVPVPEELQECQVLTDEQIVKLARYGTEIERHYGKPMDIEWALDEADRLWILQARPETVWTLKPKPVVEAQPVKTEERKALLWGLPASPGVAAGRVNIIMSVNEIERFNDGEILVTNMTAPDWVPAMRKSRAIVTNRGGMTCHAAIVSRELGVPCIVGTASKGKLATDVLKPNDQITVDATNGVVYEGIVEDIFHKNKQKVNM